MPTKKLELEVVYDLLNRLGFGQENGECACPICGAIPLELGVDRDGLAVLTCEECDEEVIWERLRALSAERKAKKPASKVKLPETRTARALSKMQLQQKPQVIPGLLARGLTFLCGSPKAGKSCVALDWCLSVAERDRRVMGRLNCEHGEVLYISLEDTWERLQRRIDNAMQGQPQPDWLHLALEWSPFDLGGEEQLDAWMEAHPSTKLITIDTFQIMRQTKKIQGLNAYQQDYHDAREFKKVADRHGIAVACIHHTNKIKMAEGDDIFRSISGSQGLLGAADTGIIIESASDSLVGGLHFRGRDVGVGKTQIHWNGVVETWWLEPNGTVGKSPD